MYPVRFWQWVARKDQCQTQLVPASSATDLLQDTAEPVSEAGGASCESIFKENQKILGRQRRREQRQSGKQHREQLG